MRYPLYFNPRAPRGARPRPAPSGSACRSNFNPRAPRGARQLFSLILSFLSIFQSTRPARGATMIPILFVTRWSYFNPRAPRGARLTKFNVRQTRNRFQSTRPARGATQRKHQSRNKGGISIHAPREGRDSNFTEFLNGNAHFNPRAPRGARHAWQALTKTIIPNFNPRAPRGARPSQPISKVELLDISIHAPREGRDAIIPILIVPYYYFNPRAPRGARQQK